MEESGADNIQNSSLNDPFTDCLIDNDNIMDAVDLTHEINAHQNGDERTRLNNGYSFPDEPILKKKKLDPVHFIERSKNTVATTHLLPTPVEPPQSSFTLPPPSMIVPSATTITSTNALSSVTTTSNVIQDPDIGRHVSDFPVNNAETSIIDGVTYNNRGYEICGALNKFNKPCQRIGRNCPFHGLKEDPSSSRSPQAQPQQNSPTSPSTLGTPTSPGSPPSPISPPAPPEIKKSPNNFNSPNTPIKKGPYKRGWTKDEHIRFLKGLQYHGKGSWKEISAFVGTRSPSQIQVHAHRYFLRQQQGNKNKRSIHDFTLEDLSELEGHQNHPKLIQAPAHSAFAAQTGVEVVPQHGSSQTYFVQNIPNYSGSTQTYQYPNSSQTYTTVPTYSAPYNPMWSYVTYQPSFNGTVQGVVNVPSSLNQPVSTQSTWNASFSNTNPASYNAGVNAYSNGTVSFSNGTPSSYSNVTTSYPNGSNSYGTSNTYNSNTNATSFTSGVSSSYPNGAQSYSNGSSSSYSSGGPTAFATGVTYVGGQTYNQSYSNGQGTFTNSGQSSNSYNGNMDSFRMVSIPQLIDTQQVQQEEGQSESFRKQEDRESDYKELAEKGLLLKDLPDIFLRSEIANEPIK